MFNNKNFYPTPIALINRMAAKIKGHPRKFLEPSAGKGDLIDGILAKLRHRPEVFAIESDPTLQATLRGKHLRLLDADFLSFAGPDQFDLIVANPPFDYGDAHLLKAISLIYSGQIIFLLNAETLRNPCTNQRKLLVRKLAELGAEVEFIQNAFLDAERQTGVEIALVDIIIEQTADSDLFSGCTDTVDDEDLELGEKHEVSTGRTIDELVAAYNETLRIGTDTIMGYYRNWNKVGGYLTFGVKTGKQNDRQSLSGGNVITFMRNDINNLLAELRVNFWRRVLQLDEVRKRLTEKKRQEFEQAMTLQCHMDFTEGNIRQFCMNLIGGYERTLTEAVLEIFDKFTIDHWFRDDKHLYCENLHYFTGWKTNSAYRIGRKVIIPGRDYGRSFYDELFSKWRIGHDTEKMLNDIDIVMNYFGGMESFVSIRQALEEAFHKSSRWDRQSGILSTYFKITVHKKGTIHLEFRDLDILRRFNVTACRGKNWLPDDYGCQKYADLTPEQAGVVDSFEGRAAYEKNRNAIMFKNVAPQIGLKDAA